MSAAPTRPFVALGFDSTHDALDAEAVLLRAGIGVVPIPAPAEVSAKCGIALRIEPGDEKRSVRELAAAGLTVSSRIETRDV